METPLYYTDTDENCEMFLNLVFLEVVALAKSGNCASWSVSDACFVRANASLAAILPYSTGSFRTPVLPSPNYHFLLYR